MMKQPIIHYPHHLLPILLCLCGSASHAMIISFLEMNFLAHISSKTNSNRCKSAIDLIKINRLSLKGPKVNPRIRLCAI